MKLYFRKLLLPTVLILSLLLAACGTAQETANPAGRASNPVSLIRAESFILNNPHFKDYVANIDIYKTSINLADLIAEHKAQGISVR